MFYSGQTVKTCDYILVTGEPRGCPAGAGCTKKVTGRRKPTRLKFAKKKAVSKCKDG